MVEPTDKSIDAWISPATASLSPEDIKSYEDVVRRLVAGLTVETSFKLVSVAHGIGRPEESDWLTTLVRTIKQDFVAVNNDALLTRVAGCVVVGSLDTASELSALVGLLVQSAIFTGAHSPIIELAGHAEAAVQSAAIRVRERPSPWTPIAPEIVNALGAKTAEPAAGEPPADSPFGAALGRLAEAVDRLGAEVDERAEAVDEEYEALWWSYGGRSVTSGDPWDDVKPLGRRVVLVAHELGQRVIRHPGPPMVRGLLGAALSDQAGKKISLGEVALAAADGNVNVAPNAKSRLLPISSAIAQITELGSGGNTWKDVLDKSLGVKVVLTSTALESALQLFREVEIGNYLE